MLRTDLRTLAISLLANFAFYILVPVIGLITIGVASMFESFADRFDSNGLGRSNCNIHWLRDILHSLRDLHNEVRQKLAVLTQQLEDVQPSQTAVAADSADVDQFKLLALI